MIIRAYVQNEVFKFYRFDVVLTFCNITIFIYCKITNINIDLLNVSSLLKN